LLIILLLLHPLLDMKGFVDVDRTERDGDQNFGEGGEAVKSDFGSEVDWVGGVHVGDEFVDTSKDLNLWIECQLRISREVGEQTSSPLIAIRESVANTGGRGDCWTWHTMERRTTPADTAMQTITLASLG
jgi:hypothetical protein